MSGGAERVGHINSPPPRFGPSVKAYFLVHVISLQLCAIPLALWIFLSGVVSAAQWKLKFSSDLVSVFQSPLNGKACRAKYRMLARIVGKIFLFLLFSNACRSDSKPITVASAATYLATVSICESDDSCFWNLFFFLIAFFQLENQFFLKAESALGS